MKNQKDNDLSIANLKVQLDVNQTSEQGHKSLEEFKIHINKTAYDLGRNTFDNLYCSIHGMDYKEFPVIFSTSFEKIFIMENQSAYDGLVFHFGFDTATKSVCYLIALGKQDGGNFSSHPFKDGSGNDLYYKVSSGSLQVKDCNGAEFNLLTKQYWCDLQRADSFGGALQPIKQIADHPRMVFHETSELIAFCTEYQNWNTRHLYITHGANADLFHAPILRFGNHLAAFPIDDHDHTSQHGTIARYRTKAFNIGRLCPPNCNNTSPHC